MTRPPVVVMDRGTAFNRPNHWDDLPSYPTDGD